MTDLIVVARSSDSSYLADRVGEVLKRLNVEWTRQADGFVLPNFGHKIHLINQKVSEAQSSLLRSEIGDMKQLRMHWLTPELRNFIAKKQLYQNN